MLTRESSSRDPEDRVIDAADWEAKREKMLDKTIADSFPASDPPSSLPDPNEDSFSPPRSLVRTSIEAREDKLQAW
jgi:hypothetical protein